MGGVKSRLNHVWSALMGKVEMVVHIQGGFALRRELSETSADYVRRLTRDVVGDLRGKATAVYTVGSTFVGVTVTLYYGTPEFFDSFEAHVATALQDAPEQLEDIRRALRRGRFLAAGDGMLDGLILNFGHIATALVPTA